VSVGLSVGDELGLGAILGLREADGELLGELIVAGPPPIPGAAPDEAD
jgi:hypothetical protein